MDEEVSRASIYRRRCVAFGRNLAEKEVGNAKIQRNREKEKRRVDKSKQPFLFQDYICYLIGRLIILRELLTIFTHRVCNAFDEPR